MTQVFVSHSSADNDRAQLVADRLATDFRVWIDLESIPGGSLWEERILNGLGISHAVVVIVTQSSVKSSWVKKEATIGRERGLLVLPLILDNFTDVVGALQQLDLSDIQAINSYSIGLEKSIELITESIDASVRAWAELNPYITTMRTARNFVHRAAAAEQLGEVRDSRALNFLVDSMLNDDDYMVRGTAAISLGKLGDQRAIPHLIEAIDEDIAAECATIALGHIGGQKAADKLLKLLFEPDDSIVYEAVVALNAIQDKRAVRPMAAMLSRIAETQPVLDADVPRVLIEALQKFGDRAAIPAVVKALSLREPRLRRLAAHVLGVFRASRATKQLQAVLKSDPESEVRGEVIWALGQIGDSESVAVIAECLSDSYLFMIAVDALAAIGGPPAVSALESAQDKAPSTVHKSALFSALNKLQGG